MRYSSWITAGPSKPNALLAMVLKSSRRQSTPTKRCVRWKLPAAPSGSGSGRGKLTTGKAGGGGGRVADGEVRFERAQLGVAVVRCRRGRWWLRRLGVCPRRAGAEENQSEKEDKRGRRVSNQSVAPGAR